MADDQYLLKVLGLSALPRTITICLSLVSYPLMVRALGVTEFGVVVYVSAVIAVFESFVDLGVSSAAGKRIAIARDRGEASVLEVIHKWARLQAMVAFVGLVPFLVMAYLAASNSPSIEVSVSVVIILVVAAWLTIIGNFVRASFTSLLAFKSLAGLDGFEAVVRSAGWFAVAFFMPSALGLAISGVVTATCTAFLGVALLWRLMRTIETRHVSPGDTPANAQSDLHLIAMIKESSNFFWLRLVTRIFQSIPVVMFGRMFGSEVVGVIGVFARIVEWVNFPFSVMGNALAVRAPGIVAKGGMAVKELWDAVSRFCAVALMLAVTIYLAADLLAKLFLPDSRAAGALIAILSITAFTTAISSIVAPMSDYVGSLRARNILLTAVSFIQVPVIWFGAQALGAIGAVIVHVLVLTLMTAGYVAIAQKAFFPATLYRLRSEVRYFLAIATAALLLVVFVGRVLDLGRHAMESAFLEIACFWSVVVLCLLLHQGAKLFFLTKTFFVISAVTAQR